MPLTRIDRGYLLAGDENFTDRIRIKGMLHWNPFKSVPEIERFLPLPKLNFIFIVSVSPIEVLAEKLRQAFPKAHFVITPFREAGGAMPYAVWAAIKEGG